MADWAEEFIKEFHQQPELAIFKYITSLAGIISATRPEIPFTNILSEVNLSILAVMLKFAPKTMENHSGAVH